MTKKKNEPLIILVLVLIIIVLAGTYIQSHTQEVKDLLLVAGIVSIFSSIIFWAFPFVYQRVAKSGMFNSVYYLDPKQISKKPFFIVGTILLFLGSVFIISGVKLQ